VQVDPVDKVRSAGKRFAEPVESMTQLAARRATELVVDSLDVNALIGQIDLNRVLDRVDVDRLLDRVDVEAVLSRVDVNALADRIDIAALLEATELSAIVTRSSTTIFSEGVDLLRSQAVGLDDFIARWVNRLLGRGTTRPPAPLGPRRLMSVQARQ
jgi:hypothetical protein